MMRPRKNIIYIFSEGKTNRTEQGYFRNFRNNCNFTIKFTPSNETDPAGILDFAITYLKRNSDFFSKKSKDKAYIVCDVDNDAKRNTIIAKKNS